MLVKLHQGELHADYIIAALRSSYIRPTLARQKQINVIVDTMPVTTP